jgi:hypothetical protein
MPTRRLAATAVLAAALAPLHPGQCQQPVPIGEDFEVSTTAATAADDLDVTAVAALSDGSFVVVWEFESYYLDHDNIIRGRRYGPDGEPIGGQFSVSGFQSEYDLAPETAVAVDDSFLVVWGDTGDIMARRFGSDGLPSGPPYPVNQIIADGQQPGIGASGTFVVAWSGGTDGSSSSVVARRLDSLGSPTASEFRVNTYTTGPQSFAKVALAPDGSFAVVWRGTGVPETQARGRWFDSSGVPVAGDRLLDDVSPGLFSYPRIAHEGDRYLIVWDRLDSDGDETGVLGRLWDQAGEPLGPAFTVNSYTTGSQGAPRAMGTGQGTFVVVWGSDPQSSPMGRLLSSTGAPIGDEFIIPSDTTENQSFFSFDVGGSRVVAAWANRGVGESDETVKARRFELPIFTDGFESGDTSAW